jgi:hypothetical protein
MLVLDFFYSYTHLIYSKIFIFIYWLHSFIYEFILLLNVLIYNACDFVNLFVTPDDRRRVTVSDCTSLFRGRTARWQHFAVWLCDFLRFGICVLIKHKTNRGVYGFSASTASKTESGTHVYVGTLDLTTNGTCAKVPKARWDEVAGFVQMLREVNDECGRLGRAKFGPVPTKSRHLERMGGWPNNRRSELDVGHPSDRVMSRVWGRL